jgi:type VI secretion system secreted protein Hcp
MALNAYLKLSGRKTGEIKGSVTQKGREGKIMVIAASHEILSPRDPASGLPTGKRQHQPLAITKEVDRSSPLLYQALANNEPLDVWELQFWRPAPTGIEQQHYTIELTNASIVSIDMHMPNNKDAALMKLETNEEVTFAYEQIQWTWTQDGGITARDDWNAPQP